ncbi:hypothetical protein QVD17_39717 [Tagetes erecta]|uniref:Uncharacterized protein n=1 Tax=Tagetes erecta TaxID=13708 RepID=A0AAD8JP17_TARER|nr:hypothetical protein QVD17_39717 [Tagetes erecta]
MVLLGVSGARMKNKAGGKRIQRNDDDDRWCESDRHQKFYASLFNHLNLHAHSINFHPLKSRTTQSSIITITNQIQS